MNVVVQMMLCGKYNVIQMQTLFTLRMNVLLNSMNKFTDYAAMIQLYLFV